MVKKGEMLSMQMMRKKYEPALNNYRINESFIQIHCKLSNFFMPIEIMAKIETFFFLKKKARTFPLKVHSFLMFVV